MNDFLVEIHDNGESWNFIFNESGATNTYIAASLKVSLIPADIARFYAYYHPSTSALWGLQMKDRKVRWFTSLRASGCILIHTLRVTRMCCR